MRIGLFDSGIGGLTVLKAFIKYHPNNEYFYYGDTLNVPYGDKSIDELKIYTTKAVEYLLNKKIDILVIACGTVSANLYDYIKESVDIPVYSVISEIPKYIEQNNYKKTLAMATQAAINSHAFKNTIKSEVIELACPKLVPLIENDKKDELKLVVQDYLKYYNDIDSIILGCTHYPLIKDIIKEYVGNNVSLIDMGEILAQSIETKDTNYSLELFFTKRTEILDKKIKEILN